MEEVKTKLGIEIKTKSEGGKSKQSVNITSSNKTRKTKCISFYTFLNPSFNGCVWSRHSYVAVAETSWMLHEC